MGEFVFDCLLIGMAATVGKSGVPLPTEASSAENRRLDHVVLLGSPGFFILGGETIGGER